MGGTASSATDDNKTINNTGRAPTHETKDCDYFRTFTSNNETKNTPLDCHALLQSYGSLFVTYLERIRVFYGNQQGLAGSGTITLAQPIVYVQGCSSKDMKEFATVSTPIKIQLSASGINKILNEVAKSGRFHTDHSIRVTIENIQIPQNMRQELYERTLKSKEEALRGQQETERKRRDGNGDASFYNGRVVARTMNECGFPTTIDGVTVTFNDYLVGWGLVGTHNTYIKLSGNCDDVEFCSIS